MVLDLPHTEDASRTTSLGQSLTRLIEEWKQSPIPGALVIAVEGEPSSGKTTLLDEIAREHPAVIVRVRPQRGKQMRPGTCILLGARAFTQQQGRELYEQFENLVGAAVETYDSAHLVDATTTSGFVSLVERLLPEDTPVFVLLDDFDAFDDFSRDLYAQGISLASQMKCILIATARTEASLAILPASHRLRIPPLTEKEITEVVADLTGITAPAPVVQQIGRMSDGAVGIVRETTLMLNPNQLRGTSHIPQTLPLGPLGLEKLDDLLRTWSPSILGALSVVANLHGLTAPFARLVARLCGTSFQELLSTGLLSMEGGYVRLRDGVTARALAHINPPYAEGIDRWKKTATAADTAAEIAALTDLERMHLSLQFGDTNPVSSAEVIVFATSLAAAGGSDSAQILLDHAWRALPNPHAEQLTLAELDVALEDGRFTDILERTDRYLRGMELGPVRLRTIAARFDASHALFEHSSFEWTIDEYERHRSDFPAETLRHLLGAAERSFALGLRLEGVELLALAGPLAPLGSPADQAEYELLTQLHRDGLGKRERRETMLNWWRLSRRSLERPSARLLQTLAMADPTTARQISRQADARPLSRLRRLTSLLVGAESGLGCGLLEDAGRQLDALDRLSHHSGFYPLRRATARAFLTLMRHEKEGDANEVLPASVALLRRRLSEVTDESPITVARGWVACACWYSRLGRTTDATDALVEAWRALHRGPAGSEPDALLGAVLPLALDARHTPDSIDASLPSPAEAARTVLAQLEPAINPHDPAMIAVAVASTQVLRADELAALKQLISADRTRLDIGSPQSRPSLGYDGDERNDALSVLTPREREVALRAINGERNRDIAAQMYLSLRTVEATLTQIYRKLRVRSKLELSMVVRNHDHSTSVVSR